ncbi:MAG: AAA family ATPase, partial [Candidatus Helarchaeota archaeon]
MDLKLTDIYIKNLFSFKDAKFEGLNNFNILIGKNNAGKSNFIKILKLLKENYNNGYFKSENLFFNDSNENAEIIMKFKLSDSLRKKLFQILFKGNFLENAFKRSKRIDVDLNNINWYENDIINLLFKYGIYLLLELKLEIFPKERRILISKISLYNKKYDRFQIFFKRNIQNDYSTVDYLNLQELSSKNDPLQFFFTEYPSISFESSELTLGSISNINTIFKNNEIMRIILNSFSENFFNKIIHIPSKREFDPDSDRDNIKATELMNNGKNLVKFLHKKKNLNQDDWREEFINKLRFFFNDIERLTEIIDDRDLTVLILEEKGLKSKLKLEDFGDGILNIALFIAFLIEYRKDFILCIEEPELYIFPGLQKELRDLLLEYSSKIQIFITTHSPHFISRDLSNYSIYQIVKENNISMVRKLSENNLIEVFRELDLSIYDYLLYDGILFVEGKKDSLVFENILEHLFTQKFKVIQCDGKKNFYYYGEARILDILDRNNLKYLFILDLDRGNQDIWKNIKNIEFKKNLEASTIKLYTYELENLFLQPILIFDYLFTLGKINNIKEDFEWLIENIDKLFKEKGKNKKEFILKRFIDNYYPWFRKEDFNYIYENSDADENWDNLFEGWIKKIEEILKRNNIFCDIRIKDMESIKKIFNKIKSDYEQDFRNKNYNKIIAGKGIFKNLKEILSNKFHLSKTISLEDLTNQ